MKYQLSPQISLEMGSGEGRKKHSYYQVVYSVTKLVQGVLLYGKKERKDTVWIGRTNGKQWMPHKQEGPRWGPLREKEIEPILWHK